MGEGTEREREVSISLPLCGIRVARVDVVLVPSVYTD